MPNSDTKLSKDRIAAFHDLYEKKLLGDYETISGNGSTLANSSRMRRGLTEFIKWGIRSILDVGCGDFNWQRALPLENLKVTAIDVVPKLIEQNRRNHASLNVSFELIDIVTTTPPAHDLVICRDVFTHFSMADIIASLNNIKQSGSRFLAATAYYPEIGHQKMMETYQKSLNKNSPSGYWRPIQLRKLPYAFPEPLFTIFESAPERALDIWNIADLPLLTPEYLSLADTNPLEHSDFIKFSFYQKLCALPYIDKIALFGSRANYSHRPDSDADFIVFCKPEVTNRERSEIYDIFVNAGLPLKLDCMIFDPVEHARNHIRILYDRSRLS